MVSVVDPVLPTLTGVAVMAENQVLNDEGYGNSDEEYYNSEDDRVNNEVIGNIDAQ